MNEFFGTNISQQDLQGRLAERRQRNASDRAMSLSMAPPMPPQGNEDNMNMTGMVGDSLDDIILQNNKEIQRRHSLSRGYSNQSLDRRSSMLEFGSSDSNLNGFQFGSPAPGSGDPHLRRQSAGEVEMNGGFEDMSSNMTMSAQQMGYTASMHPPDLNIDTSGGYPGMPHDMVQGMMGYGPMTTEGMMDEDSGLIFASPSFSQTFGNGGIEAMSNNDFMMPTGLQETLSSQSRDENDNMLPSIPGLGIADSPGIASPRGMSAYHSPLTPKMPSLPHHDSSYDEPTPKATTPVPPAKSESVVKSEKKPNYAGIYSSSGFDMLGALMKVATRANPEVDIGKVDLSCAFVVCDITLADCPIIYISEVFERLTGYNKHEVLGQNCRFLQSPEGKVQEGVHRDFTDNNSVYYLKNQILAKKEAQRSLINYRKGGQPFMNLLTMVPISGDTGDEIRYIVGFQVDLVEKPSSLENKNASGMYTVDYSQGQLPKYVWNPPQNVQPQLDGQTISRDDVSTVLGSINNHTESELTKRMWDKVLLENTDDVVHVLSLKGLFLYLSPSCRKVLEYDSSELVGTALSSVCHPSDIVPVTRELKDTSTGVAVNVVFRIRRKKSGYTWFESHGSLCVEQGKGRKCIILVGRERPVYALSRHDIEEAGGIGENEMWTKISTSGMFLFVPSNVRTLLDRAPEDLVGTSIQVLMRPESKVEFGRSLEKARRGRRVTHKHEVLNKRGVVLQAQTTLYPGDASEGQKPTFLVAQTRLLKTSSRSATPASQGGGTKSMNSIQHGLNDSALSHPSGFVSQASSDRSSTSPNTVVPGPITQAGGGGLAIGSQDLALASEANIFEELKTTRCTSWQFELRQMEKSNRLLAEELSILLANKKKRKRRKGAGHLQRDCANCHTRQTPEWRRGPSGQRDLCNSCGLRWAKQTGRVSPRTSTRGDGSRSQHSTSPVSSSPLQQEVPQSSLSNTPNLNPNPNSSAAPQSLGGRSTADSQPVRDQSKGFREGGDRGITRIEEESGKR
ncbi:White collar 1 protein [Lachnellula hyalina]|uniref:White collar 1 protein n=1 Tax=Lachnellula hyalina TaxID=1316788 RepID=A0A8H8U499_9HELO|nr:White collar 1 protein [Lachnellula hyalina]TVY30895.1 White collar 1 protein [Lachnellula hyalina]